MRRGTAGPDAWASMQKNKMVRIATDPTNIPFEMGEGTDVQGYDVDLGNEIAKDLGHLRMGQDSFRPPLRDPEKRRSGNGYLDDRHIGGAQEGVCFFDPYFDTGNTIARRIDNTEIKSLASLAARR